MRILSLIIALWPFIKHVIFGKERPIKTILSNKQITGITMICIILVVVLWTLSQLYVKSEKQRRDVELELIETRRSNIELQQEIAQLENEIIYLNESLGRYIQNEQPQEDNPEPQSVDEYDRETLRQYFEDGVMPDDS